MTQGTSWGTDAYPVAEPGSRRVDYGKEARRCECCDKRVNRYRGGTRIGRRSVLLCCNCAPDDWRDKVHPKPVKAGLKGGRPGPKPGTAPTTFGRPRDPKRVAAGSLRLTGGVRLPGLRAVLAAKGHTASRAARKAGTSPTHVQRLARGGCRASHGMAAELARVLGVPVADLTQQAEKGAA